MIKYVPIFFLLFLSIQFSSCEKVPLSTPEVPPVDSNLIVTGSEYFVSYTIDGSTTLMQNRTGNVSNSVTRELIGACALGADVRFVSYFAYASDTSRKSFIGFGLSNCVADTADGISDSTYVVGAYPMEIPYPDTAVGFIYYMDNDSMLWTSGLGADSGQLGHSFVVDSVRVNYDGTAALEVIGSFTGWVYNGTGDSMLVSKAEYYSKAWAL